MTSYLISKIDKLSDHHVIVIGDLMLDRFIYGQVDRISPEAPIPVLHIQRESVTLGGAGNVLRNIISLGGKVELVGVIGDDLAGEECKNEIAKTSGVKARLLVDKNRPTTVKTRYVANGQQLLRADNELAKPISVEMEQESLVHVRNALNDAKVLILSDYAKGALTPHMIKEIIKISNAVGCKVLIDPKGRDYSRYHGAYMLTPNRKELSDAIGYPIQTVSDAERAARHLITTYQLRGVLAKLGADGVCLVMDSEETEHFHTVAREVFDVSGAGDTVMATLALAIASNFTASDAAQIANLAGSVVVGKIGTASVTRDELIRELMHDQSVVGEQKIMTASEARDVAERWRKKGYRVGFTNGCFDLLHPGHVSMLRQARAACDKLIVAINSDNSVKRIKGERRPIQGESSRAAVLASLSDVDGVVVFDEDTPYELIRAVRPDILVKGADYTIETIVGSDLLHSWNGKVLLATLVEGHSTTATIAKATN